MGLNHIDIMGRLCDDPRLESSAGGSDYVRLSIACDRMPDKDGNKVTDFIPCVFFGRTAEFFEKYFRKGDMCAVSGRLQSSKYRDRDGNPRISWAVMADHVYFAGGKSDGGADRRQSAERRDDDSNWPPPPAGGLPPVSDFEPDEEPERVPF